MSESIAIIADSGEYLRREDRLLPIYSITKTYIAACVLAADVPVEAPISKWIDTALVPRAADITVRNLLNHSSGLRDYGVLPEYQAAIMRKPVWSDGEFADRTLRQELLFEPGSQFSYSNPGYWLLSKIVQAQCGLSFDGYMRKFVIEPLELKHTRVANGTFAEDLPDYPSGWVWHGLLLASASEVVQFLTSSLVEPLHDGADLFPVSIDHPQWRNPHYGYGVMVEPGICYGHNGEGPKYSAACFHFVESGLTGCVLCSAEVEGAASTRLQSLIDEASEARHK